MKVPTGQEGLMLGTLLESELSRQMNSNRQFLARLEQYQFLRVQQQAGTMPWMSSQQLRVAERFPNAPLAESQSIALFIKEQAGECPGPSSKRRKCAFTHSST